MLCSDCSEKIELISVKNRCPICFEEQEGRCLRCANETVFPRAFTCEDFGPAQTLERALPNNEKIQRNVGSLMVVQLCLLSWPMPDVLLPLPTKDGEALSIAKQISSFIPAEVRCAIQTEKFVLAADGLKRQKGYSLKKGVNLSDKNCLVVSLSRIKEEEKEDLAKLLYETAPKGVYFLSFI